MKKIIPHLMRISGESRENFQKVLKVAYDQNKVTTWEFCGYGVGMMSILHAG